MIGNIMIEQAEDAVVIVRSNFTASDLQDEVQRVFVGSIYTHLGRPASITKLFKSG